MKFLKIWTWEEKIAFIIVFRMRKTNLIFKNISREFFLLVSVITHKAVFINGDLLHSLRIVKGGWKKSLSAISIRFRDEINNFCKGHSWSVSQMSRQCVCLLKNVNYGEGELCQACLTQGQVAQRRFMVQSGVRTLESGRLFTKSNTSEWDSNLGHLITVVRLVTTVLC